jgi:hypothetical protein
MVLKAPVIILLPVDDLIVTSWNPRKIMEEGPLRLLTDYVRRGGPLPRILVWKGEGKAPYAVISGQRRLAAYRRAGVRMVEVEILDITLEEAKIMASTSNEGEPVYWLDKFENWETLLADYPTWGGITALALKLGRDGSEVNRAINLMKLLTPEARKMVRDHIVQNGPENKVNNVTHENFMNSDGEAAPLKDTWRLKESAVIRLNGLWKGRSLPDAQALAEKAIPLMLSKQMKASQVNQWVIKANGGAPKAPSFPTDDPAKGLVPNQSGEGTGATQAGSAQVPKAQAKGGPTSTGLKPVAAPGVSRGADSPMKPAHPNLGHRLVASAQGWWPELKSFLLSQFKRALGHEVRRWIVTGLGALVVILLLSPHLYVSLYHLATGYLRSRTVMPPNPGPAGGQSQVAQPVPQNPMGAGGASAQTPLDEATSRGPSQGSAGSKGEPAEAVSSQAGEQAGVSGNRYLVPNQGVSIPNSGKATPATNSTQVAKGEDPLKAIGDGVKDYQSAVNTAGDAKAATDKAKGLLPF